jgi:asparagine synthase (glutamine-hydrolysing)
MCGIAGIVIKGADRIGGDIAARTNAALDAMESAIIHRGPDEAGRHVEGGWGFLNRRLSIIDIAGGTQPFYSADKRFGLVYNGETYNFTRLRETLEAEGARFESHTDSEVVLRQFERDGVSAFSKFDGMYGACIWDSRERVVYVARDAFGIKPVYIYEDGERIAFASEIGALLALASVEHGMDLSLDHRGVADYATFRYTCTPYTVFRNIRRLSAGEYAQVECDQNHGDRFGGARLTIHKHTDLCAIEPFETIGTLDEEAERLHDLLRDSVRDRLVGEAPVALLLSGGLDSSIVAVLLHELGVNLEAFNIGFPEVNEFAFSAAVAEHTGITVHNVEMTVQELIDGLDDVVAAIDEPVADPACFPLYRLCHEVKKHATVVLSGEGADELFSGYPQHRLVQRPLHEGGISGALTGPDFERFNRESFYFLDAARYLRTTDGASGWRRHRSTMVGASPLRAMTNYDLSTWLAEDLMMKADKVLMRHSLEGRFPFLQDDILRLAQSIPDSYRMSPEGVGKLILRKAFNHRLPRLLLERPKMGFTTPTADMLTAMRDDIRDTIEAVRTDEIAGIIDLDEVSALADRFEDGAQAEALRLWTLFILLRWFAGPGKAGGANRSAALAGAV